MVENFTMLADFEHSDSSGTNIASGFVYQLEPKFHVGALVAKYTPPVGPSSTATHIFGTLPTANNQVALNFNIGMANGSPNQGNSTQLLNVLDVLPQSPITIRMGTESKYGQLKDTVFTPEFRFNY